MIVVDPQEILDEPYGARLLYIALTRTTTRLDVLYPVGRLPEVLGGTHPLVDEVEDQSTPKPESDRAENQASGRLDRSTQITGSASREKGSTNDLSRVERRMVRAAAEELMAELESVPLNLREHVVAELVRLSESP